MQDNFRSTGDGSTPLFSPPVPGGEKIDFNLQIILLSGEDGSPLLITIPPFLVSGARGTDDVEQMQQAFLKSLLLRNAASKAYVRDGHR